MNTKVNEGKLISGKDALIALANGESVQKKSDSWGSDCWLDISKKELFNLDCFLSGLNSHEETIKFRLKPRTIKLSLEIPAPFEPKEGEKVYRLAPAMPCGYTEFYFGEDENEWQFGAWRTEGEVKQVVAALRQIFGGSHD